LHAIDEDEQLHCLAGVRVNASEGMNGDGRVGSIHQHLPCVLVIHHLNREKLLAHQLVPIHEEFVAVKAMPILAPLGDLRRREAMDVGRRFGD
jgi:hypothetical protein